MSSNKNKLAFSRNELARSKRWRGNKSGYGFDDQWRRYVDLYGGLHYDVKNATDQLTVNLIFSTINVMGPAVAINNPRFIVNARKPENVDNARVTEEILNYLWHTYKYQRDFRLAVHDWMIVGHGWLKIGFAFRKSPPEVKKVDVVGTNAVGVNNDSASEGADEGIDDREDVPGNVESEMNVDDDRPFIERISPFDMYVDPDARHPKEMRWIAQRTWRAVQDVMADSRYSATARKQVSASSWSKWEYEDGDARAGSDTNYRQDKPDRGAVGYVEIIEFYDLKRKEVSTFSPQGDTNDFAGYLIKPTAMPYSDGHPFVMLRNYEVPDHFYTMGDVQQIESLQLELNETRNQMLNYRKKFRRAWLYAKDLFDREGIRALESEEDNVAIPVMGDADPSRAVAPVPAVITPPEFFDQSAMISADIDRVSGVSDYQRGQAQTSIKRTATEAAMIQDSANARAQDRLAKIEDVLAEAAERVVALMQQYLTGDHVARIVTMPVRAWINYDKDYLQGRFDFEVRGGSTEPRNETFRRQSAMQLVDASMPFLEMGVANPMTLYMKILQDGFGEKDPQRFIQQQPDQPAEGAPPDQSGALPAGPPQGAGPPLPPGGGPQEHNPEMQVQLQGGGGMPPNGQPPMPSPEELLMMAQEFEARGEPIPPELLMLLDQMQQMQGAPMGASPPMM